MRYSLGSWRGIPIDVHLSLLLFLGFFALRMPRLSAVAAAAASLFGVVLLHEAAHAVAGIWRGHGVAGLSLQAFGGLSALRAAPATARDDVLITLAGPLSTLASGVALSWLGGALAFAGGLGSGIRAAGWISLYWASFNLLPAYPMDGGRLLFRALAWRRPVLEAAAAALRISQAVVVLVGLYGLLAWRPAWMLLAAYLYWRGLLAAPEVLRAARETAELGIVSPPPYARRPPQRVDVTRA